MSATRTAQVLELLEGFYVLFNPTKSGQVQDSSALPRRGVPCGSVPPSLPLFAALTFSDLLAGRQGVERDGEQAWGQCFLVPQPDPQVLIAFFSGADRHAGRHVLLAL